MYCVGWLLLRLCGVFGWCDWVCGWGGCVFEIVCVGVVYVV